MSYTNSFLHQRYRQLKKKFERFSQRYHRSLQQQVHINTGKLHKLALRLNRMAQKLQRLETKLKLAGTSLALGTLLGLSPTPAEAQTKRPGFASGVLNPFGITNPGSFLAPTFADIDGDGDLDLFLGEGTVSPSIYYFENTGNKNNPTFAAPVSDPFGLGQSINHILPTFIDLDGDGDLDALWGSGFSDAYYFENTGSPIAPAFQAPAIDTLGLDITSYYVHPTLKDLDADGDLDALFGTASPNGPNANGDFLYYENTGDNTTPTFGSVQANPFGLANQGTYSTASLADLDGDGDFDMLASNVSGTFSYFENTGNNTNPTFGSAVSSPFGISGSFSVARSSFADLDGDGDLDYFVGSGANITYFENTSTVADFSAAAVSTNPFGLADVGNGSNPSYADLDGDGDLDLFIGDTTGTINYFTNTGDANSPTFTDSGDNPFGFTDVGQYATPSFCDIDGDGDLDAFVGEKAGTINYFQNTGDKNTPTFAAAISNPFGLSNVLLSKATFADIDADGDYDIFVADYVSGNIMYFQNTGNKTNPTFATAVSNPFGFEFNSTIFLSVSFADLDGDGDLDAFVGEEVGETLYYKNTGNQTNPTFASPVTNPFNLSSVAGNSSTHAFADLDGDGDLDILSGGYDGNLYYFQINSSLPPQWSGSAWSPSTPTASTSAELAGDYDVNTNGDITCTNLLINSGQTLTMTSGSITVSGDFENNGNAFTQTGGMVTFNGSIAQSIQGSNTFDDITINSSGGVTVDSATTITGVLTPTSGTLNANGQLTLASTAASAGTTAVIDFSGSGTISGNVTQQRFLDGATQEGYRYIAPAVTGQTLAAIDDNLTLTQLGSVLSPSTNESTYSNSFSPLPNIFYYDQTLVKSGTVGAGHLVGNSYDDAAMGWEIPASTSVALNPGSSVALKASTSNLTIDFTGSLQSSDVILSLNHGGQTNSGWHMVGNPFAATLDWNAVYDDGGNTGVEATAYVFDAASALAGTYGGYNASTNAAVSGGSQYIASGQAFFIQTTSGMTGNVTLKTSHTTTTDVEFFRTQEDTPEWFGELRLKLSNAQGQEDELLIYSVEEAQEGQDIGDAKKFFGTAWGLPEIASQDFGFELMMDCREPLTNDVQTYTLAIKGGTTGEFKIKASTIAQFEAGTEIYLEDKTTNQLVLLEEGSEYNFEVNEANEIFRDRFFIHMQVNRVTGIEDELEQQGVSLFATGNQVNIQFEDTESAQAQIKIFTPTGQLIKQVSNQGDLSRTLTLPQAGIYIVQLENASGIMSKRILIL